MDQEAKYWRDKWIEATKQMEALEKYFKEKENGKQRTKQK